jgi:WD40 repeat protein
VFVLIASLLVTAVLVSMMVTALVLSYNYQSNNVATGKTATGTIASATTTTSLPVGSVVYTRSSNTGTNVFPSVAWSPDSKRIATLVVNLNSQQAQVQIWDAITGGNLLTVPLADNLDEVLWSPTGKYLALNNLQTIVIIDAQTGSIVNTINFLP